MAEGPIPDNGKIVTRAEAKAAGLKHYITGKPCLRGHVSHRYTSIGMCVACATDRGVAVRSANPELVRDWQRAWRASNIDKVRADARAWRSANPEKARAEDKKRRLTNPDKVKLFTRIWRENNTEHLREYDRARRAANPEAARVYKRNRKARIIQASGTHTAQEVSELLKAQKYKCANCSTSILKRRHLDHIHPIALGGANDIKNLQWLCPSCNQRKSSKHPIDWAREQGRLV